MTSKEKKTGDPSIAVTLRRGTNKKIQGSPKYVYGPLIWGLDLSSGQGIIEHNRAVLGTMWSYTSSLPWLPCVPQAVRTVSHRFLGEKSLLWLVPWCTLFLLHYWIAERQGGYSTKATWIFTGRNLAGHSPKRQSKQQGQERSMTQSWRNSSGIYWRVLKWNHAVEFDVYSEGQVRRLMQLSHTSLFLPL